MTWKGLAGGALVRGSLHYEGDNVVIRANSLIVMDVPDNFTKDDIQESLTYQIFQAIDLPAEVSAVSQPVYLVHSADPACARLAESLPEVRVAQADSRRLWTESPGADSPPVSTEAIRQIIDWCRLEFG